jgi:4-aminobutyrate aminotransferase-like enzyme
MNVATNEITAVGAHLNEVYPMLPFTPVRGLGVYLENAAGRRVLDLYGGHAVAALGYGHRDLSEALARQSRELVFQTNALPLKVRDEAAEKLAAFGPPGLGRVFFVNSGAEANENALRLAFKVTGRAKVVAMEHSFHGRTAAAGAVTYGAAKTWYGFPRTPFDVVFVPRNDAAALAAAVDSSTAAVIIEPVQGLAGAFDFAPEFMHAARAACDRAGALLIIDEVQTGFGRTGDHWFGIEHWGVEPDIMVMAKGIASGFPVGATITREEIAEVWTAKTISTFGGNPISMAAMNATLEVMIREDVPSLSALRGARLRAGLGDLFRDHAWIGEVRGMGLMQALELVEDRASKTPSPRRAVALLDACKEEGLLVGVGGLQSNVIRLGPSMLISEAEVDDGLERMAAACRRVDQI